MGQLKYAKLKHGRGVFALSFIPKGTVLAWYNTKEISEDDLKQLSDSERRYTDQQKEKWYLIGEPERFINHSCDSNLLPGQLCDIASRDIQNGEELTADYSHFFILAGSFECNCESKNCRKIITGKIPV